MDTNDSRHSVLITNTDTVNSVFIGPDTSITTSNAIEIPAGGSFYEDDGGTRMYQGPYYGIASTTVSVRFWERSIFR